MGTKNLASTGIRSHDRPFCNELLYRLRYPGLKILQHLGKEKHDRRLDGSPRDSQADVLALTFLRYQNRMVIIPSSVQDV